MSAYLLTTFILVLVILLRGTSGLVVSPGLKQDVGCSTTSVRHGQRVGVDMCPGSVWLTSKASSTGLFAREPKTPHAAVERNGVAIAGLLERAATMATGLLGINRRRGKKGSGDKDADRADDVWSPLNLRFVAKTRTRIDMQNPTKAREYLALPASKYSLLNASFVTRVTDEIFLLTLPLDSFGGQIGIGAPVSLCTNITVSPRPEEGKVLMKSGAIVIRPSVPRNDAIGISSVPARADDMLVAMGERDKATEKTPKSPSSSSVTSSLPVWLIYGASASENGTITDTSEVQSSLQTGVDVELAYPRNPERRVDEEADDIPPLKVSARVEVDVRLSLPLPHDVSSVLNFLPLRGLLSQAGGLLAKTILQTLAPELSKALVADYEARMLLTEKLDCSD